LIKTGIIAHQIKTACPQIVLSQATRNIFPDPAKYSFSHANTYFVVAMEFLLTPNNINVFAHR
jgi:hypothetical protein